MQFKFMLAVILLLVALNIGTVTAWLTSLRTVHFTVWLGAGAGAFVTIAVAEFTIWQSVAN